MEKPEIWIELGEGGNKSYMSSNNTRRLEPDPKYWKKKTGTLLKTSMVRAGMVQMLKKPTHHHKDKTQW